MIVYPLIDWTRIGTDLLDDYTLIGVTLVRRLWISSSAHL